jgi:hypothetical protein
MATASARRRRAIEHLVATDLARARLARAAFDAVVDGLDLGPTAVRTAADRTWVQVAIAGPIQQAADQALERLVDELIGALGMGNPDLVARLLGNAPDVRHEDDEFSAPWVLVAAGPGLRSLAAEDAGVPDEDGSPTRVAVLR